MGKGRCSLHTHLTWLCCPPPSQMWLAHLMDKHDPQLVFFQAGVDGLKGDRWVQSEGKLEQGKGGKRDQRMDGSWEPLL